MHIQPSSSKILSLGLFILAGLALEAQGLPKVPKLSLAAQCAPDLDKAPERIFANSSGKGWKEYGSVKQAAALGRGTGEALFAVKTSGSGRHYVRIIEYTEDSARFEGNCYDNAGRLRSMQYEVRTAWGWGYEDRRQFDTAGRLASRSTRFFKTTDNQNIDRPAQASDVPNYLKPTIYRTFDSMPFTVALKKEIHATPQ